MAANSQSLDLQSTYQTAMQQLREPEKHAKSARKLPIMRRPQRMGPEETALKEAATALATLWNSKRKR
jgi:hypothetical protein